MRIPTFQAIRKTVGALCALLFLGAAARMIVVLSTLHFSLSGVVASIVAILLAVGLFRDNRMARRCTAGVCLLASLIVPFGIFSPFAVGDYLAAREQPPDFYASLVWLIPLELALWATIYVLDPKKSESASNASRAA